MKKLCLLVILAFSVEPMMAQSDDYHQFFTDECLRVDYELVGNREGETAVLKELKTQGVWAGPKRVSTELAELGNYRISVADSATGKLLYSNGFSSLFNEWQQTPEATTTTASFYHVSLVPMPRRTVLFRLERTNYDKPGNSLISEFFKLENRHRLFGRGLHRRPNG